MSAKKATSATTRKSTAAGKSAANGKAPATRRPASLSRTLSPLDIGAVAGEIWALLCQSDGQTLATLKKSIHAPPDVVVAAVGWLAREDKLEFTSTGRTLKISLKS